MTDFNFAALAQRTCPESYHAGAVPAGLLMRLMMDAINALNALDAVKKTFAYGRDLPTGLSTAADPSITYKGELDGHILHSILGTATEGGELLEAALRTLFNGEAFDTVNFQEELGDIAWYRAIGLNAVGQTIEQNDRQNIDKLVGRFPDKFDATRANNRDLVAERRILQGFDAELRDAQWFGEHIYGKMFGDAAGRFPDGTDVHTTDVVSHDGGDLFTTKTGSVYKVTFMKEDDHAFDLTDVELVEYGPNHDRLRGLDDEGAEHWTAKLVLKPFLAGDEYGGEYRGQTLATDATTLYRIKSYKDLAAPGAGDSNGISRV